MGIFKKGKGKDKNEDPDHFSRNPVPSHPRGPNQDARCTTCWKWYNTSDPGENQAHAH